MLTIPSVKGDFSLIPGCQASIGFTTSGQFQVVLSHPDREGYAVIKLASPADIQVVTEYEPLSADYDYPPT